MRFANFTTLTSTCNIPSYIRGNIFVNFGSIKMSIKYITLEGNLIKYSSSVKVVLKFIDKWKTSITFTFSKLSSLFNVTDIFNQIHSLVTWFEFLITAYGYFYTKMMGFLFNGDRIQRDFYLYRCGKAINIILMSNYGIPYEEIGAIHPSTFPSSHTKRFPSRADCKSSLPHAG